MTDAPRRELLDFTELMEKTLRYNDRKGSWKKETMMYLTSRLVEEVGELLMAVHDCFDDEVIKTEAADVANFALMIQDNYCEDNHD